MARKRLKRSRRRLPAVIAPVLILLLVAAASFVLTRSGPEPVIEPGTSIPEPPPPSLSFAQLTVVRPQQVQNDGYVGSQVCQECHPRNHATWSASYHRRMTQVATPDAVLGDFDNVEVESGGRSYKLSRRRGVCWVEMDDPELPLGQGGKVNVPIVMTTGSHHMQVYWYPTFKSRVVGQLPLVFLNETQQWIPRNAAFLRVATGFGAETGRWNQTCIACHTTHGQPRPNESGGWDSEVGEFGISCEACHGPAEQHVQIRTSGLEPSDDPIVNPADLPHRRASQVCGQCHSISGPLNTQNFLAAQQHGSAFRPGDDLDEKRWVVRENAETRAYLERYIGDETGQYLSEQYWPDGMVRISGREYNGLVESPCFQEGTLSCLTCHLMHQEEHDTRPASTWANDQLRPELDGDKACLECHDRQSYGVKHTHHASASTGSRCYNCHMPHTTYGLLKAIRSHEITRPDVSGDLAAGRPNACNLCHLDRTLEWTSDQLNDWYGTDKAELNDEQKNTASSLLWLLRGDAGQRALVAWGMGWSAAKDVSGSDWQAPFLACLLDDPYDAVRLIAHRSLRGLPGFEDFRFDYVGPPQGRGVARGQAWQIWHEQRHSSSRSDPGLLITEAGIQLNRLEYLLRQRDDRPINLAE